MEDLRKKLEAYQESDFYPFHMPGHKRRMDFAGAGIDITEIDGFDNLHHATGILADCQRRYAGLTGAKQTYFLVNGSTCGILAAISAGVSFGGTILMARNSHKSAYHALYLRHLKPVYVYPEIDQDMQSAVLPEQISHFLQEQPQIQAVYLTSPTYDGIVSDIRKIAEIVHANGKILIVDEAHGAHFGWTKEFPDSAVHLGADIVIQSVHKTLPSLTQTAVLHLCSDRISREKVERFLGIYETSSPSYVLMSSISECERIMRTQGTKLLLELSRNLQWFYENTADLNNLKIMRAADFTHAFTKDPSKILIQTSQADISGVELYDRLRTQYHLQPEMCSGEAVTALTSVYDTTAGFRRLADALHEIDAGLQRVQKKRLFVSGLYRQMQAVCPIHEAWDLTGKEVMIAQSAGKISLDFVYLYPPGIPVLVPGERIREDLPEKLTACQDMGLVLQGMRDPTGTLISVTDNVCNASAHQLY